MYRTKKHSISFRVYGIWNGNENSFGYNLLSNEIILNISGMMNGNNIFQRANSDNLDSSNDL